MLQQKSMLHSGWHSHWSGSLRSVGSEKVAVWCLVEWRHIGQLHGERRNSRVINEKIQQFDAAAAAAAAATTPTHHQFWFNRFQANSHHRGDVAVSRRGLWGWRRQRWRQKQLSKRAQHQNFSYNTSWQLSRGKNINKLTNFIGFRFPLRLVQTFCQMLLRSNILHQCFIKKL